MRTTDFDECNSNNENGDLPCYQYADGVICCWKSTLVERARLLFTGRIWVSVLGSGVPPMLLTTKKPLRRCRIEVDKGISAATPQGFGEQQKGVPQDG